MAFVRVTQRFQKPGDGSKRKIKQEGDNSVKHLLCLEMWSHLTFETHQTSIQGASRVGPVLTTIKQAGRARWRM